MLSPERQGGALAAASELQYYCSEAIGLKLAVTLKAAHCPFLLGWKKSTAYGSHYRELKHVLILVQETSFHTEDMHPDCGGLIF